MNISPLTVTVLSLLAAQSLTAAIVAQPPAPGPAPAPATPHAATPPTPATAPAQPAAPKSEGVITAEAFRAIWTGSNASTFGSAFLRRELREEATWKPDEGTVAQIEKAKKDIEDLLKIAAGPAADWQVRTKEEGFDAKVPHWPQLQTTSRVFFADARRLTARNSEGDAAAAVERVIGIMNLAKHFENEKLIGAVRTGRQVAVMGLMEAKRLADAGKLSADAKAKLLATAIKFDSTDPLDMRGALLNEATITIDWTKRICTGSDAAKTFIIKFAPKTKPEEIARSGVQNMDEATLHRQVESVALCYREVVQNWDSPNSLEAIKAIEQQRLGGDFGGPAALLSSELQHHRATTFRLVNIIDEVIKSLGGTPKPK